MNLTKYSVLYSAILFFGGFSSSIASDWQDMPLIRIGDLEYLGGFRVSDGGFNGSSMNYSQGPIAMGSSSDSLFIVGHNVDKQIFEINIPSQLHIEPVTDDFKLLQATPIQQTGNGLLDRPNTGNSTDNLNVISGLLYRDNKLYVNAYEYYDAGGANTLSTLILDDASDLSNSNVRGYFSYQHTEKAAGWFSNIPTEYQSILGGKVITGHSSGPPINLRNSMGPSAFVIEESFFQDSSKISGEIKTSEILGYYYENHPHDNNPLTGSAYDNTRKALESNNTGKIIGDSWDLYNSSGTNKLWNLASQARFGFIVPGTRTYAVFGHSAGHESGLGYKIKEDDGYPDSTSVSDGFQPYNSKDKSNYYWLFDMKDLVDVALGHELSHQIKPYEYGPFDAPFQVHKFSKVHRYWNRIGGGAFDPKTNKLYLNILGGGNLKYESTLPPVIVVYQLPDYYRKPKSPTNVKSK